jgi:uncharacterized protein (TIGR02996 family)
MHDEAGFLSAIRQTPADDTARLVFADWLDEQDDPTCKTKSAFIRLELRMAESPEQSLNRVRWTNQLQKLAAQLEPAWLAAISHPKLEACRVSFRFQCPKQWEKLAPTDDPKVRHCGSCRQHVHYCDSLQEARYHATRGSCVALTLALVRKPNDLLPPEPVFLAGVLAPPPAVSPADSWPANEVLGTTMFDLPPPVQQTVWETNPVSPLRITRRPKRKKGRGRNRNIQRDNWEDAE